MKMRNVLLTAFFLMSFIGTISAQEITFPELEGYKKSTDFPVYGPDNLWDFINGAADTYLSYGFVDLHIAEYKKGKNVIKLEIYRQGNSTLAFGIYSTERSPSFRFVKLGAQGYIADGAVNFFKGSYYVKIRTYSKNEKTLQSTESLALKVSNMLEGDTEMPAVLSLFPENGRKVNDESFINESVLGHKFLNKAFRATYEVGTDNFSIFIFDNRSNEESLKMVQSYLTSAGMDSAESGSGKYMVTDGYNGSIFLAWKENRIVIVSGLSKDQADVADRYTSEILK
jgi:hypothetical protein